MSSEIKHPWLARFERGPNLTQFDDSSNETLFREVLNRETRDRLLSFTVGPVTVDMTHGSFHISGLTITPSCDVNMMEEYGHEENRRRSNILGIIPKRLIYFRRTSTDFGPDAKPDRIVYALGWQATIEGRNLKHILYIHPNGELVIQ